MRIWAPLVVMTACGGGSSDTPVVLLDATRADSAPQLDATHATSIAISNFGAAPLLLAMRDGAGLWQALATDATSLSVTQPTYELLAVCPAGTAFETAIAARAVTDGPVDVPCFSGSATTPPTTVAITGDMAEPGSVWMGTSATGATSPWSYQLDVAPGMHDLIAADAANIAIQRDLSITAAASEPAIDVDQTGTPFDAAAFALSGVAGTAIVTNQVLWFTHHEQVALTGTGATVSTIPAALLDPNTDFELVALVATDGLKAQAVEEFAQGPLQTTVTMLPELSGVAFSGPSASWTALPPVFDSARLDYTGTTGNIEDIAATAAFLTGATSLAIELTDVPGYQSAWRVRMTGATHQLEVSHAVSQITTLTSSVRDGAPFAGKRRRLPR